MLLVSHPAAVFANIISLAQQIKNTFLLCEFYEVNLYYISLGLSLKRVKCGWFQSLQVSVVSPITVQFCKETLFVVMVFSLFSGSRTLFAKSCCSHNILLGTGRPTACVEYVPVP